MLGIGEYARTNKGNIFIYTNAIGLNNEKLDYIWIRIKNKEYTNCYDWEKKWLKEEKIIKHSRNIIDLIEVGDYVNGVEVVDIVNEYRNNETEKSLYMDSDMGTGYRNQMFAEHIKSIVTKEKFERMKYKVKED